MIIGAYIPQRDIAHSNYSCNRGFMLLQIHYKNHSHHALQIHYKNNFSSYWNSKAASIICKIFKISDHLTASEILKNSKWNPE